MRNIIRKAIESPDDWVLQIDYLDKKGITTRRVVSPIRIVGKDRMLALCLCREETRQFHLTQCSNMTLLQACDVLMPVPMHVVQTAEQNQEAVSEEAVSEEADSEEALSEDSASPSA
ncbi:MAG: hypothetical protein ABJZ55_04400 [Fuerstiella sp.]